MPRIVAALLLLGAASAACEDTSYRDIGGEINLLTTRDDALVPASIHRLAGYGRAAIVQIETALHTASPAGKQHLLAALTEIGDAESVPVFRHFALYDPNPEIRRTCEERLSAWAGAGDGRARAAAAALGWVADRRNHGEGPLLSRN